MTDNARTFSGRQLAYFNELLRYTAPVSGITVAAHRACLRFLGDVAEIMAARLAEIPPEQIPAVIEQWFQTCSDAVFAPAEPGKAGSPQKAKGPKS